MHIPPYANFEDFWLLLVSPWKGDHCFEKYALHRAALLFNCFIEFRKN